MELAAVNESCQTTGILAKLGSFVVLGLLFIPGQLIGDFSIE